MSNLNCGVRARWVGALLGALCASAVERVSDAQTLRPTISESFRGGVAVDGWAVVSSRTDEVPGVFRIRLPRGARVRQAVLYDVVQMHGTGFPVAAGPAGSPRRVTLGRMGAQFVRNLEGMPDQVLTNTYGLWRNDVTTQVRAVVGAAATGGIVEVPATERGDEHYNHTAYPQYLQHQLVVLYDHDAAPVRTVVVYEGLMVTGNMSMNLPLPVPAANRCPMGSTRGEPFAASVGIGWEYTGSEEDTTITVNGMNLTTLAGGADDWDQLADMSVPRPASVPSAQFANGLATAALGTVGSFGGAEPSMGVAVGSPLGVDGDAVLGAHSPASRRDDELYDFRGFVPDGASSVTIGITGNANEVLSSVVVQMLGRLGAADADGDGHTDAVEGDCTTDTDADGTPDYLDADSDNDCLPDRTETAASRTNPATPAAPDANCVTLGLGATCDTTRGVCGCATNADCRAATRPICDPTVRQCIPCTTDATCAAVSAATPACVTTGANAGACVQCVTNAHCPSTAPVCDATTSRCTDPDTDGDTIPDRLEFGPGGMGMPRDSDGDMTPDFRDPDDDGDSIPTRDELGAGGFAMPRNSNETVPAGEGVANMVVDYLDPDDDGDGIPTRTEATLEGMTPGDADGVPAYLDRDSDGDTIFDAVERGMDGAMPRNSDGEDRPDFLDADDDNDTISTADEARLDATMADDFDGDGVPSHLDLDSDADGLLDRAEGTTDGDMNMAPDFLDPADDSDGDGVPNAIERGCAAGADGGVGDASADGSAPCIMGDRDTDNDGTPDYLDPDDDGDGIPTRVERSLDPSVGDDLDMDGAPSYRDLDSDGDSVPDAIERAMDGSNPANTDGVMDGADFLDTDSDNDCVGDRDPREAGAARTDAAMPSAMADSNCSGDAPVCDTSAGVCVRCVAVMGGASRGCESSTDGRACVAAMSPAMNRCGCAADMDCAASAMCDTTAMRCVPRSMPDAGADASVDASAEAGRADAAMDSGAPPSAPVLSGDGACACRVPAAPSHGASKPALLLIAALAAALSARKARR